MTDKDRLIIFDTTLRDGEQSPGCTMNRAEKLRVAQALADLRVDVIEAGFPIASPGDFESVREIAQKIEGPTIAGLARCTAGDIDRAWEAVQDAASPRIHVFLATSAIHRERKLKMAKEEIIRRTAEGVSRARSYCDDVEFSPEDASRTEPEFLAEVVEAAIKAGATTINIPDTVGYAIPREFGPLFRYLTENVPGVENIILSAHCHNDLGMAVANSIAAVENGARQVECTINGIGERAGNCSLEEIVMLLATRDAAFDVETGINTTKLYPTSRLVSSITGSPVQANKAIVGDNAFAHEAGIHQHGMLQNSATYEIMTPETIGLSRNKLVLGKHSGRHAFKDRVEALGLTVDENGWDTTFDAFKALADKKKDIYDEDIEAIVLGEEAGKVGPWKLIAMHASAGTGQMPTASIQLAHADGRLIEEASVGDGPIDAVIKAIERATGSHVGVRDYQVHSVTVGEDAQGEVVVLVEHEGQQVRGHGISTDIMEASALAFVTAINRIDRLSPERAHPQHGKVPSTAPETELAV